ncbi:DMT family transporter [Vibrio caribbeanicus]|uniref:DMT family transporter n=1 Tax=Vibrio caribbeanicus TaxID=701175 RepID=UPI002284817E|nr:multidrug transporter [Vibrio caribbeanicus]MCY9844247.1 multidrug transporter [Vibrio caribbeanicus]
MKWFILLLAISSNAFASILIKKGVSESSFGNKVNLTEYFVMFLNYSIFSGIVFYFISFVSYAIALSVLPLNVVHPVTTSGAILLVLVSSCLFFDEKVSSSMIIGFAFIIAGVFLVTKGSH